MPFWSILFSSISKILFSLLLFLNVLSKHEDKDDDGEEKA